jgi:hypothetical protein
MNTQWLQSKWLFVLTFTANQLLAQTVQESVTPLSKKAHKGYMDEVKIDNDGNINVLYKIKGDKKADELFYEQYTFDKNLKFIESKPANEPKVDSRPDKESKSMGAWVGGNTSFDVLSMKLKAGFSTWKDVWDYKKQRYVHKKRLTHETIKLKNEDGRSYYGIEEYETPANETLVLCYYETGDKSNPRQYVLVTINFDGEVKEKNLDVKGNYSLVFCKEFSPDGSNKKGTNEIALILAPNKGMPDLTQYILLRYDLQSNFKGKVEFKSPVTAMLVNSLDAKNGDIYFSGMSKKSTKPYEAEFNAYSTIESPGYQKSGQYASYANEKYRRAAEEDMDFFHLIKISNNKLIFASTSSINDFKSKIKYAPGEKGAKPYKGHKFYVSNVEVTPANEYLVSGQLLSRVNLTAMSVGVLRTSGMYKYADAYQDLICLHFDQNGQLKAQYAVDKVFEDRKSEIFKMPQTFFLTPDGKYAYWLIGEVKGFSGYNSFSDAVNDVKSFRARYFPRINKIDLQSTSLSEFKYPGNKKFFYYEDDDDNGITYSNNAVTIVGRDEDHENVWVCKVTFE